MKKIITKLFVFFILVSMLPNHSFAQYFIPEKLLCEQLKSKTLIVELKEDSSGADEVLRNAFKDLWTLTPIEFLPGAEFNRVLASGDTNYAALLTLDGESTHAMERWNTKWGGHDILKTFYMNHFDYIISLLTGANYYDAVCTVSFINKNITNTDLLFMVQQMSRLVNASLNNIKGFDYYNPHTNIEFVKTKTLLIPKELFKEKELPKLKDKYPYPFKIVTLKEMNEFVFSKNEEYIYPKIIWCAQQQFYGWVTINAKDGSVTSIMTFGGVQISADVKSDELIKIDHLKYIASEKAQGINNKY
jgi:hypothetical protein